MDFSIIFDNCLQCILDCSQSDGFIDFCKQSNCGLAYYVDGFFLTIQLTGISLLVGLLFAIPLAVLRTSKNVLINSPIRFFVYVFRGTPLIVQMYIIYYGLGQFDWLKETILWAFFKEAYFCALFAFTLNTCAYTVEIIRGALDSTPFGEIEAAKSVGMSYLKRLRRIILPSALRRAFPAYGNEVIFMLHGSALASVITLLDITGAGGIINARFYAPYEAYITAGVFYLAITFTIVWSFKKVEKRIYAHLQRAD
ncbi:MAG: ABC transporter permease [Proteobacteria bacterium]|nr:ABC transporter permease [Pseudomonadota bacterium]